MAFSSRSIWLVSGPLGLLQRCLALPALLLGFGVRENELAGLPLLGQEHDPGPGLGELLEVAALAFGTCLILGQELLDAGEVERRLGDPEIVIDDAVQHRPEAGLERRVL